MDLKKIIKDSGLRLDHVAAKLFPDNAHPYDALNRVMSRGGSLKAEQVKALAEVLGVSADELLGLKWSGKVGPAGMVLKRGAFTVAILNHGVWELWTDTGMFSYVLDLSLSVRDFMEIVDREIESLSNVG